MFDSDITIKREPDKSLETKALETKARLRADFLAYTSIIFKARTGVDFNISAPVARESHHRVIARKLMDVYHGRCKRLLINVPPRYTKTEFLISFITWCLGRNPNANFIYSSYSKTIAMGPTGFVRQTLGLPEYRAIFDTRMDAKRNKAEEFYTSGGGCVYTAGVGGSVLGKGAGVFNQGFGFGGAFIIDDPHNSEDVYYDNQRKIVLDWFDRTAETRLNDPKNTPIIAIMQRLHEDDMSNKFIEMGGWDVVSIPALITLHDGKKYALDPSKHTVEDLEQMQARKPYVFASHYQQCPSPSGGGLFKEDWFSLLDLEPEMIESFIVIDSAETDKTYNDATAISFFGCYRQIHRGQDTGLIGLHWINCIEAFVEPADLEPLVMDFYADCMRHKCKPKKIVVEDKSTGVTLASVMKRLPGAQIIKIKPTKSKITRFIDCQEYVATNRITLPKYSTHTPIVIKHCGKIAANDSHARDDIADTLSMAIQTALIDGIIVPVHHMTGESRGMSELAEHHKKLMQARSAHNNKKTIGW